MPVNYVYILKCKNRKLISNNILLKIQTFRRNKISVPFIDYLNVLPRKTTSFGASVIDNGVKN